MTSKVLCDGHVCYYSPGMHPTSLPISQIPPRTPNFLLSFITSGMFSFLGLCNCSLRLESHTAKCSKTPLPPPGLLFIFPVRLALTILFKIITPTSPPGTHCSSSTAYSLTPFITSLIFTLLSSTPDMPYILCICLLSCFVD